MPPKTRDTDLRDAIRDKAVDPFKFEEFLGAWHTFLDGPSGGTPSLEADAETALLAIAAEGESDVIGTEIRRMLNSFPNPALVVRHDGVIMGQNEAALRSLAVDPGDLVDSLPLGLIGGESLSERIKATLTRSNSGGTAQFLRAVTTPEDRSLTLALVPTKGAQPSALLFVIDPQWAGRVEGVLAQAFQLTDAEAEILAAFLDGQDLKTIAQARSRSLATVRTQMQTIMTKAGVGTQAELMRNALALSQFQTDIQAVADVAHHPHRKRLNVLRPGGRSVDVVLAGDLSGQLVTFIPDITLFTFTPDAEAHLARNGLCMASIARPGFGGTDPTDDTDYEAVMAADICAVQDQLGFESSVLLAHSTATGYAYRLGGLMPDRFSKIVLLSTLAPLPYLREHGIVSPWAGALLRGARLTPSLFKLMVAAGVKAWKVMGSRRFARMQMADNPEDAALVSRPDQVAELDSALAASTAQGVNHSTRDLDIATSDWSDWVRDCKVPVVLFHGAKNTLAPIAVVRAFAADFPDLIQLVEIPEAGFMIAVTHRDQLAELLRT